MPSLINRLINISHNLATSHHLAVSILKMAAPTKRRAVPMCINEEEENSDDNSSEISEENEDSETEKEVQVEFEARTPEGDDLAGIKSLLRQLFLKAHIDLSSLAEIILQQYYVSSVIKQSEVPEEELEDDSDDGTVFGITTVINITERKGTECIHQIKTLLTGKSRQCGTDQTVKLLRNLLDRENAHSHHVGLLLSERFINIPAQIAPPLYENLCKEMQHVDVKHKFNFDYYILICKIYKLECTQGKKQELGTTTVVFSNPEEEIFYKESLASFEYSVAGECDTGIDGDWDTNDMGMKPFRQVLVIPAERLDSIVSRIRQTYGSGTQL